MAERKEECPPPTTSGWTIVGSNNPGIQFSDTQKARVFSDHRGWKKMPKRLSAGLLMFREGASGLEVLLVHPGGPFWTGKDEGAWSIPKGELEEGEDPLEAARREFREETGMEAPSGKLIPLEPVRQPGGKTVKAWAFRGNFDPEALKSNTFSIEWPPKSGKLKDFPEVDRAAWMPISLAKRKILKGQRPFLFQLEEKLDLLGHPSDSSDPKAP